MLKNREGNVFDDVRTGKTRNGKKGKNRIASYRLLAS
jgi:hypothetical protein